jgi:hypothetical protein
LLTLLGPIAILSATASVRDTAPVHVVAARASVPVVTEPYLIVS